MANSSVVRIFQDQCSDPDLNCLFENPITLWDGLCNRLALFQYTRRVLQFKQFRLNGKIVSICYNDECSLELENNGFVFERERSITEFLDAGINSIVNDPFRQDYYWCFNCKVALFRHEN